MGLKCILIFPWTYLLSCKSIPLILFSPQSVIGAAEWTENWVQLKEKSHENQINAFRRCTTELYSGGKQWSWGGDSIHVLRMEYKKIITCL